MYCALYITLPILTCLYSEERQNKLLNRESAGDVLKFELQSDQKNTVEREKAPTGTKRSWGSAGCEKMPLI